MEIKIQIFGKVYSLSFGHKTEWFEQLPFFMLIEEEYNNMEVSWARVIFQWRKPKF